jgi:hypothetical protein
MNKDNYDLNNNGTIDPDEKALLVDDRKRRINDADAKRDAQLKMCWYSLSGMLGYPFLIVIASYLGLSQAAELLADIAAVYVVAVAGITSAYFGFSNMGATKNDNAVR